MDEDVHNEVTLENIFCTNGVMIANPFAGVGIFFEERDR